jgi:antitoxin component YwqK of YwqJK toxin-antitoxin module
MKNKVKSALTYHADLGSEETLEVKTNEALQQKVIFDAQGNISEHIQYLADGSIEDRVTNSYNADGKLAEEVLYDPDGEIAERRTLEYAENGKLLKEIKHYQDGAQDLITYSYNEAGHLLEKIFGDDSGWVEKREAFTFEGDKLTAVKEYDEEGKLLKESAFTYDADGNLEESSESPTSDMGGRKVTIYNISGLPEIIKYYSPSGNLIARHTYEYNENDLVTDIKEETQSGISSSHTEYDEIGHAVVLEDRSANEELNHRIERTYDEEGNLLTSHVFINGHGRNLNQHYLERIEYTFFDQDLVADNS